MMYIETPKSIYGCSSHILLSFGYFFQNAALYVMFRLVMQLSSILVVERGQQTQLGLVKSQKKERERLIKRKWFERKEIIPHWV